MGSGHPGVLLGNHLSLGRLARGELTVISHCLPTWPRGGQEVGTEEFWLFWGGGGSQDSGKRALVSIQEVLTPWDHG